MLAGPPGGRTPMAARDPQPRYFETPDAFRRWLDDHYRTEDVLWVGFKKKGTGLPSITWPESVAEALCFGWIDGLRKRIDDESYTIRFTPRRPGSRWSAVNIRRIRGLIDDGRVRPAGLAAFEERSVNRSRTYSYEQRHEARLDDDLQARFEAESDAWKGFQSEPPGYRETAIFWVMSAKRPETRERRLGILVQCSAEGERIPPLRRR